MKSIYSKQLLIFPFLLIAGPAHGQANNAYPNGIEGIKAASIPPPGYYYRMYTVFYQADTLQNAQGDKLNVDFDLNLLANTHRFLWISDYKLLGGYLGADIIVPIMNVDMEIDPLGVAGSDSGVGDIAIEPLVLSWHGTRFDAAFGISFFMPTGHYDRYQPASIGQDMWTSMFSLGGTYYPDNMKTISASLLARYEMHGEKKTLNVTPGDDFHVEWGIGKSLAQVWEIGLAGYGQWQVTRDDVGSQAKDRVYAIGPEINLMVPQWKSSLTLRGLREFGAKDRSEGNFVVFTFTKAF